MTLIDIIVTMVLIVLIGAVISVLFMNVTPVIAFLAKIGNMTHTASNLWNENYVMSVITFGIIIILVAIVIIFGIVPFFIRRR